MPERNKVQWEFRNAGGHHYWLGYVNGSPTATYSVEHNYVRNKWVAESRLVPFASFSERKICDSCADLEEAQAICEQHANQEFES